MPSFSFVRIPSRTSPKGKHHEAQGWPRFSFPEGEESQSPGLAALFAAYPGEEMRVCSQPFYEGHSCQALYKRLTCDY